MKFDDMSLDQKIMALDVWKGTRASRQFLYVLAKEIPAYRALYEEQQAFYEKVSAEFGLTPEPVFDEEEYRKSDRYKAIMDGRE